MDIVEEVEVNCPQCGAPFTIEVETTQREVRTIEDCAVCCHPINFHITCSPGEITAIEVGAA